LARAAFRATGVINTTAESRFKTALTNATINMVVTNSETPRPGRRALSDPRVVKSPSREAAWPTNKSPATRTKGCHVALSDALSVCTRLT